MPPRKRAAADPKAEQTVASEATEEDQQAAPTPDDSAAPAGDDAGQERSDTPPEPEVRTDDEPKRSDLQAVDEPCTECFPRGWPDQAFAVGCEHGTWQREATD